MSYENGNANTAAGDHENDYRVDVDENANETGGDGIDNRAEGERLDEEAQVEENVAGFVDEEEEDNDEYTPHNSDCEEEGRQYLRCQKGSGNIRLGQVFDNISQFKEAVVDYALKEGCNVKFTRWGPDKSEVKCSLGGDCKFRIYCSYEAPIGAYMVKRCEDEHSCIKDGFSKVVKDGIIAKLLLNDIRKDPTYKPKTMQDTLEERYNLIVTPDQCRKAKRKALSMIQDEHDEQFSRIKDYRLELL
ncbi:PREDICTED: uncharacterized protein LOC104774293, partial [Camelina sativa]